MSASDPRIPLPSRLEAASVRMGIVSLSLVGIGLGFVCVASRSDLNVRIFGCTILMAMLFGLAAIFLHIGVLVSKKRQFLPPDQLELRKKPAVGPFLGYIGLLLALFALVAAPKELAPRRPHKNSCVNNLRQLEGAKEQWAFENKKTSTDRPFWEDLVGKGKYFETMPVCPNKGTYVLGNVGTPVRCTVPGHTLR